MTSTSSQRTLARNRTVLSQGRESESDWFKCPEEHQRNLPVGALVFHLSSGAQAAGKKQLWSSLPNIINTRHHCLEQEDEEQDLTGVMCAVVSGYAVSYSIHANIEDKLLTRAMLYVDIAYDIEGVYRMQHRMSLLRYHMFNLYDIVKTYDIIGQNTALANRAYDDIYVFQDLTGVMCTVVSVRSNESYTISNTIYAIFEDMLLTNAMSYIDIVYDIVGVYHIQYRMSYRMSNLRYLI